jgi:hypothetical protein
MAVTRLGTVSYAAGTQSAPFEITVPDALDAIELRCTGTLTVGTSNATLVEDNVLNTIRRVLISHGGRVVHSIGVNERYGSAGRLLNIMNRLWYGQLPPLNVPAATVGTNAFDYGIRIPFRYSDVLHRNVVPIEARDIGCMRREGERIDLVIDWGVDADVATPGSSGTAVVAMTAEVLAHTRPDLAAVERGVLNRYHRLSTEVVGVGSGASASDQQRLNAAVGLSGGFLVLAVDNGARDGDYINRVKVLLNGTDLVLDSSWDAIVANTRALAGLQVAIPDGYGWVDFDSNRDLGGYLPLGAQAVASSVLDLDHDASAGSPYRVYVLHAFLP